MQDADKEDEVAGAGSGLVDSFDLQGNLIGRVATAGTLNAPWGLAIAPSSFGVLAGDLLVGNFGDGRINIFDAGTHALVGQVLDVNSNPLEIDGLWALAPGNNGNAGSSAMLYFTAGPDEESKGLFGVLEVVGPTNGVPEPATLALLAVGLAGLGFSRRKQ